MEKYSTLEDIESVTHSEVVKQNKISMAAIGFFLLSVLLTIGGFSVADPNSAMATFAFTAAVFLFFGSVVKFCMGRNCYLFKPTGSRIKQVTLYFDNKESGALQTCMEEKKFDELKKLKRQINTGVKMDAMVTADGCFVAVQLSEYVPYTYEAISPVMCYYDEDARRLSPFFQKNI